jgi:branched-chain amino acid transport system ATP-binding protein
LRLWPLKSREHATVASLPHGDQRKLEVALLMALEPKVFMFDEPTAGMNAAEAPVILDLIRKLKARQEQDDPAGRAQDGRGARTCGPDHRAAQRHAGGGWRTGRGDRLAVVQEAYLGIAKEAA